MNLELLEAMLEEEERFVPHVYHDHLGIATIGIGRMVDGKRGGGISYDEAKFLLRNDIEVRIASLNTYLPWWTELDEIRQLILLDMSFNLGIRGLLTFKNTLRAIQEGRYSDAAEGMRKSLWYKQTGRRARRLIEMMKTGNYISMRDVK